ARYELAAALLKANGQPLADADYQRLRSQLAAARKADAQGLDELESELKQHGHLPQGSLAALLDSLKPSATAAAAVPTPAAPVPAAPTAPAAAPGHAPTAAAATKAAPGAAAKPAAAVAGNAAPAAVVAGNDPCARPDLAGKG